MSFAKNAAAVAFTLGALSYSSALYAQVGGGTEQPSSAKTTPQSKGESPSDDKGSMSKDSSMEKSGGSMKKEGSMEKSGGDSK